MNVGHFERWAMFIKSLENALLRLARGEERDLLSCLIRTSESSMIDGTKTTCHCHHVKLDGNSRPLVSDLIQVLHSSALDYAIPRSRIAEAQRRLEETGSSDLFVRLAQEARELFTDLELTGEGGELLLFLFAERLLKAPQLFSKMYLKTSERKHYEGGDAIHAGATPAGKLALYWGEAKVHADWKGAISKCLGSLCPFLRRDGNRDRRDLQLLRQYVDLADPQLEAALISYLDPLSPNFMTAEYCGLALVGFTAEEYTNATTSLNAESLLANVKTSLAGWNNHAEARVMHEEVATFQIHLFLSPFPDVDDFRKQFLGAMGR